MRRILVWHEFERALE